MDISVTISDPGWRQISTPKELIDVAAGAALLVTQHDGCNQAVCVVLGSDAEVARLNKIWRNKAAATNVLSFPAGQPKALPEGAILPLGDIILAYAVVAEEAGAQGKALATHLCHLIVHAMLHLLGYDHQNDDEAEKMEMLEIAAMKHLGLPNPYEEIATAGNA